MSQLKTASPENPARMAGVPKRQCGKHDLTLPILGIGCWAYGGGDYWGQQSQKDVNEVVHYAVEHGCNYFDTAEVYNNGDSETSLGNALRGIQRERVIIGTKISPSNTEPKILKEHCDASLKRLQTDYIDLYMVHWPITAHAIGHFTRETVATPSVTDAFATLIELQRAGKIRHIGVSNFGRAKLDEALATGADIVINELPYSLLTRAIETDIMPYCESKGVGVLGYMALMQGVLGKHYASVENIPVMRRRTRHFDSRRTPLCRHRLPGAEAETDAALQAINRIAHRLGMRLPDLALKWACARSGITSSLCGSRNLSQLKENIQAASEPLSREVIAELNRVTQPLSEALGPSFDYYEHPDNDRTR